MNCFKQFVGGGKEINVVSFKPDRVLIWAEVDSLLLDCFVHFGPSISQQHEWGEFVSGMYGNTRALPSAIVKTVS
jgi:hypothetical protein